LCLLTRAQVPVTVRKAKSLVVIAAERPDTPFPKPSATVGYAAQAWPGIKEGELLRAVEPLEGEAVLHLRRVKLLAVGTLQRHGGSSAVALLCCSCCAAQQACGQHAAFCTNRAPQLEQSLVWARCRSCPL
jgi:hypothetical protein